MGSREKLWELGEQWFGGDDAAKNSVEMSCEQVGGQKQGPQRMGM